MLLALQPLMEMITGLIASPYRATGHLPRGAVLFSIRNGLLLAIGLVLVAINSSFLLLTTGQSLMIGVSLLAVIVDLKRIYPWLNFWPWLASGAKT